VSETRKLAAILVSDVVEESDGDLMGDGVNIAARLESVAKPGAGVDTETLAGFGLAAMMANDNDLIRSPPIPV
jgi:hypothetical protein